MAKDTRPIEVGDRFEDMVVDWRSEGRIIQITGTNGEDFTATVDEHPKNASAVGRETTLSEKTLRTRYRRISR